MMTLDSITVRTDTPTVEPSLVFDVAFMLQRGKEVPLGFTVTVRSEDKVLLGPAVPCAAPVPNGNESLPMDAGSNENRIPWLSRVVLPLTPRLLNHLEDVRAKHRKQDVVLLCDVETNWLSAKTVLAPLAPAQTAQQAQPRGVAYVEPSPGAPFYSQFSNMWVLSGDGGRTFIERGRALTPQVVTIRASDWIHDHVAAWKNTKFVLVELPEVELLAGPTKPAERVNAAIESIRKATDNLQRGEWNDVLEDLRPVWELLRNHADVQDLLKRDGYTPEAIDAFNESVNKQFTLASKFIHRIDLGKKVSPEIRANKEDALMCYSFAMTLVNLVTRKALRLGASTSSP